MGRSKHITFLCPLAALTGQMAMTPGLIDASLAGMTLASFLAFCAMALVKDYSGGRFIHSTGELFMATSATVLLAQGSTAKICSWCLLLIIPLYLFFSLYTLMHHLKNNTLSLLPGSPFRG